MDYIQAQEFLSRGKSKTRRPLSGRSSEMVLRENSDIAVKYHATDVVTFHSDGRVTLNSDGYRTVTTKERINEYAPVNIYQRSGMWYMVDGSLFYDGITVRANGDVIKPRKAAATEGKKLKLDKLVSRYVKAFQAQIASDKALPEPSVGDCWYCCMVTDDGKSLGESVRDADHILSHLKEQYIFGSILWQAVQRRGNPSFVWQWAQSNAEQGRADYLMGDLRYYLRTRKAAMLELM